MLKKILKFSFMALAALIILIPAFTTNIKKDQVSEFDNTKLPEFPTTLSRSGFENYLSYRIGMRPQLITSYQRICYDVFGILVHPLYMIGKNGQIYDDWDLSEYQHLPVDKKYVNRLANYLNSAQKISGYYSSQFWFLYVPNKESIYFEDFPDGYNVFDSESRSDYLVKRLQKLNVNTVDVRDAFLKERNNTELFNRKYDVGHWNANGALLANKILINDYINPVFPEMKKIDEDELVKTTRNQKYLINSYFKIDEDTPWYEVRDDKTVTDSDEFYENIYLDKNKYHLHMSNPGGDGLPKILILGDSYFGSYICYEYYKSRSSEIVMLHTNNHKDLPYYLSFYRPDIVIFEAAERVLSGTDNQFSLGSIRNPYYLHDEMERHYTESDYSDSSLPSDTSSLNYDKSSEYHTISVPLKETDSDAYCIMADIGQNRYYSAIDRQNEKIVFTFRVEDLVNNDSISYRIVKSK